MHSPFSSQLLRYVMHVDSQLVSKASRTVASKEASNSAVNNVGRIADTVSLAAVPACPSKTPAKSISSPLFAFLISCSTI